MEQELLGGSGDAMEADPLLAHIRTRVTDEGLIIEVFDIEGSPLFAGGHRRRPNPIFESLVSMIGRVLSHTANPVAVTGHLAAGDVGAGGPNPWRLSSDRAQLARDLLTAAGVADRRVARVSGKADRSPVDATIRATRATGGWKSPSCATSTAEKAGQRGPLADFKPRSARMPARPARQGRPHGQRIEHGNLFVVERRCLRPERERQQAGDHLRQHRELADLRLQARRRRLLVDRGERQRLAEHRGRRPLVHRRRRHARTRSGTSRPRARWPRPRAPPTSRSPGAACCRSRRSPPWARRPATCRSC